MKTNKVNRWLPIVLLGETGLLCVAILSNSVSMADGIRQGIEICLNTLIPSMFIFLAVANFISDSSLGKQISLPFQGISRTIFHLDSASFTVFLLSMIGGYPIGAKLISSKIRRKEMSIQDGQRMLSFCTNCSPAFLISGVSVGMWGSAVPGMVIYFSQILAAVILAFCTAVRSPVVRISESDDVRSQDLSSLFVHSVNSAAKSMGIICIFVVFFCGFFPFIDRFPVPESVSLVVKGILEVTSGCQMIRGMTFSQSVYLVCLFTAFGGICVHLQLTALLYKTGIKMGKFLFQRVLYTALSLVFTGLGCYLIQLGILPSPAEDCFTGGGNFTFHLYSVSPISSFFLLILCSVLLLFPGKSVTIKKNSAFKK